MGEALDNLLRVSEFLNPIPIQALEKVVQVGELIVKRDIDIARADIAAAKHIAGLELQQLGNDVSIVATIGREQLKLAAEVALLETRGTPETILVARDVVDAEFALLKRESRLVRDGVIKDVGIESKIADVTRDLMLTDARLGAKLEQDVYDATLRGPVDVGRSISAQLMLESKMQGENRAELAKFDQARLSDGESLRVSPGADKVAGIATGTAEFGSNTDVYFANGINTRAPQAVAEAAELSARVHQDVTLVYVETKGIVRDVQSAYGETMYPALGRQNAPERTLGDAVIDSLDRGRDVHVIGYSRGALVTELALDRVVDHYGAKGYSSDQISGMIMSRISVETFNGASHNLPRGVSSEHYVSDMDVLVGQTIGMGPGAPLIRGIAGHGIDDALALANSLPIETRRQLSADAGALLKGFVKLHQDAMSTQFSPGTVPRDVADLARIKHDLDTLKTDIAHVQRSSATPGGDEIAREGYANQNATVHRVPVYFDTADRAKDLIPIVGPPLGEALAAVEQHDLPPMLPYRQVHSANPTMPAGHLSEPVKSEVEAAIPPHGAHGNIMPTPRSVEPWDGKKHSGTMFHVSGDTYAIHVGRGDYQVIEASDPRLAGQPFSNQTSYVDLQANRPGVEPQSLGHQPLQISAHGRS